MILVADDSPVYRKLVEQALSQNACTVCFANTGREAIEIFERLHPAIVITDWVMPDLTGIELCRKIRADVHAAYTYIIILTSNAEKENVVKGLSAGADDYLTKPFHRDELLARVRVGERLIELQRQIEAKNRAETLRRNPEAQWKKVRHFRPYRRRRVSSNRNARGGIGCALVVERIREQLMSEKFVLNGTEVTVTASFGVAGFCGQRAP